MFIQTLRACQVHEVQQVLRDVGCVALFLAVAVHALGNRAVAEQVGVRIGVAEVQISLLGLITDLSEQLVDLRGGNIAPAGFLEIRTGYEVIKWTPCAARLELNRTAAERATI